MTDRFGIKIGRTGVATIKRKSADGPSVASSISLTLRDEDMARAGQFELSYDVAAQLISQLTRTLSACD
jgi:hypothetical protein